MATLGSVPAAQLQPAAERLHTLPKQVQPFDARLLYAKLEATKRQQDARRAGSIQNDASKGAYVPRTAARQHGSTLGADNNDHTEQVQTAPGRKRSQKRSNGYSADGKPCVDPARLRAALNEVIAESCALVDEPSPKSPRQTDERPISALVSRRSSAGDAQGLNPARRLYDTQHKRRSIDDARPVIASRNYVPSTKSVLVPTKHGSQTVYERVPATASHRRPSHPHNAIHDDDVAAFNVAPRIPPGESINLNMFLLDKGDNSAHFHERPGRIPHDRPHWAQQSECGDSMRELLHGCNRDQHHHHRAKPRPPITEARMALECINIHGARPPPRRTKSTGEPDNLVNEAVAKIKREEKARWRRSVAGLFRRP